MFSWLFEQRKFNSFLPGIRAERQGQFRLFPEVHRNELFYLNLLDELFGSAGKVASHSRINRKHGNVDVVAGRFQNIQFMQEILFRFFYFLFGRFVFPVPVVEVSCMKDKLKFACQQERHAYIGRAESLNPDQIILVNISFVEECRFISRRLLVS